MDTQISFGLLPYKVPAEGVFKETVRGGFVFDVLFTTNSRPGFVVQYVRKTLTVRTAPSSAWVTTNHAYWEIFYIAANGESWNADRFAQTAVNSHESEGCFIQIGYAYFFPYPFPVEMVKNNIRITPRLQSVFGDWVALDKIVYANGLPSAEKQPAMKDLAPLESAIIHKLTGNWGPHVEQQTRMPSAGWNTIIDEEVFSGPLIYDAFPWDYPGPRPLLKKEAGGDALSRRQWKASRVPFAREGFRPGCPRCGKGHPKKKKGESFAEKD